MERAFLKEEIFQQIPDLFKDITEFYQGRERDIVLLSAIGVISACLPKVYGVYDSNKYAPNLYLLIIAPAASGKGAMVKSKKLIEQIHEEVKRLSLEEIANYKKNEKAKIKQSMICPQIDIKLLPGNVSSSKIYSHMQKSTHGLLIFETEADTISTMLKQDWGNFSDVLRKAFHHEAISISRESDNKFYDIQEPKLSLVLSGTPNQVAPLINSQENGLFSRFLFYFFDEPSMWKDVSPNGDLKESNMIFSKAGDEIFCLYNRLLENAKNIEVRLTTDQWDLLNVKMNEIVSSLIESKSTEILPTIKRLGPILFRICMIFTIVRNRENLDNREFLFCEDIDFHCAFNIIQFEIDQANTVSSLLKFESTDSNKMLFIRESQLLTSLSSDFQRKDAIEIGEKLDIPIRSIDYILNKLKKSGHIEKLSNGVFRKIDVNKQ